MPPAYEFEPEVESLENVPEAYHGLYSREDPEDDTSSFRLDQGLHERLASGTNAAKALRQERERGKQLRDSIKAFSEFGETPDEVREKIEALQQQIDKGSNAEQRIAEVKDELTRRYQSQIDEAEKEKSAAIAEADNDFLESKINSAVASDPDVIPRAMTRILKERLRVVREDGKRRLVVLDDDGEIAHDPISGKDLGPEGFVKRLKQSGDEDHAFKANNGSGSGSGQDQGAPRGGTSRRFTMAEWQAKLASAESAERKKLISEKFAGRITVTP